MNPIEIIVFKCSHINTRQSLLESILLKLYYSNVHILIGITEVWLTFISKFHCTKSVANIYIWRCHQN